MQSTMTLWSHALAALLFGMLALAQARRAGGGSPRLAFVAALGMTALWALAVAGIDARDVATRIAESLRNVAWLAFMFTLVRRDHEIPRPVSVAIVYAIVVLIALATAGVAIAEALHAGTAAVPAFTGVRLTLRMMVAVSALLLANHLYALATPRARGGLKLAVLALAAMWSVDLVVYVSAYLASGWPAGLGAARGVAMVVLAPVFAVAVHRNGNGALQVSRTVAFQSLSAVAIGLYVVVTGLATGLIGEFGGAYARIAQTAFVFGSTATLLTIVSTPWLRAWAKVIVSKHLFSHRYDYRAEWMRFTETLGVPGDEAASLDVRVVKAVADVTESPAGVLLVPEGSGLGGGAGWNWDSADLPSGSGDEALLRHLETTRRIIELDAVRNSLVAPAEAACVPSWMIAREDAWAIVPLVHFGRLAGAILLARPAVDRALDWEDFDLLGIVGRQAASYLAEEGAHAALADAQRFDEFNRRFAFIMHDLKNLVSQLTLVARNAERHADNPAFRADMIATLQDSSARMNILLARLSQHHGSRGEPVRPVPLLPLIERIAVARRAQHAIMATGDPGAVANADPAALAQVIEHLVQNAIEASAQSEPITLSVSASRGGVAIDVVDRGCGMAPAFVRDRLFRPFVSSKDGGFGIGAFEARQLAEAMGGSVTVVSREGEGTRFRITLPAAIPVAMGEAA